MGKGEALESARERRLPAITGIERRKKSPESLNPHCRGGPEKGKRMAAVIPLSSKKKYSSSFPREGKKEPWRMANRLRGETLYQGEGNTSLAGRGVERRQPRTFRGDDCL